MPIFKENQKGSEYSPNRAEQVRARRLENLTPHQRQLKREEEAKALRTGMPANFTMSYAENERDIIAIQVRASISRNQKPPRKFGIFKRKSPEISIGQCTEIADRIIAQDNEVGFFIGGQRFPENEYNQIKDALHNEGFVRRFKRNGTGIAKTLAVGATVSTARFAARSAVTLGSAAINAARNGGKKGDSRR